MVDTNVSSFSSGDSNQLPRNVPKQSKIKTSEKHEQENQPATQVDTTSKSTGESSYAYGSAPSIMAYTESVDLPKYNLSNELLEANLSDYSAAKRLHNSAADSAGAMQNNQTDIDTLSNEVDEVYDAEEKLVGETNKAIAKFNEEVVDAAKNKKIDGTTLVDATQQLNKQIDAYNNGDITADELQKDIQQYNSYLSDWDSAMSDDIAKVNTAIDAYNTAVNNLNEEVDKLNAQLTEYGCTYQLPEMETLPNIPSSGIPPVSTDVPPAPMPTIEKPKEGVQPIELPPNSQPPSISQLESQMTNPPQELATPTTSIPIVATNLMVSQQSADYTEALLKKLNKQLPVDLEIIPRESYYQKTGDVQRKQSPVIKNLGQIINQQMLTSSELVKQLLGKDDAFVNQMAMMTQQIFADSVLSAVSDTYSQLSDQNPTGRAIDIAMGVNLSGAIKREMESGRVESAVAAMNLPQDEKQKVSDIMNLTLNLATSKFISMGFSFKGMEEQLLAQGFEGAGIPFPRKPVGFNQVLQNGFVIRPMVSMSQSTLVNQNNFSEIEARDIANDVVANTMQNVPYGSLSDLRNSLSANFKKAGVSNPALAGRLADDLTRTLALFIPFSPAKDSSVSSNFQLLKGHQQIFDDPQKYDAALSGSSEDVAKVLKDSVSNHTKEGTVTSMKQLQSNISQDLMKEGLSKEESESIAQRYTAAVQEDSGFSGLSELTPAKVGSLQAELESRFDPSAASALMEGLVSNPGAINDEDLASRLSLAVDVSSRIPGGASVEQLKELGITDPALIATVQSLQSSSHLPQQAFEIALRNQLSNGMKIGPSNAKSVGSGISFDDVVDSAKLVKELSNTGVSPEEAGSLAEQILSIPEAYQSEEAFKSALNALLPTGISSENLNLSGLIKHDELRRQVESGLVDLGVDEAARSEVLNSLNVKPLLSSQSFTDEVEEQLVATTGMSYEQASKVAEGIIPGSILDFDKIGDALAEEGLDSTVIEPILNNVLSAGKFAEMVRDVAPGDVRIDLKQLYEDSIQTEKLQEVIRVGLESQGVSPEESEAMAKRGSQDLFKVKTQSAELNSIYSMAQPKWLEASLQGLFEENGVPGPLTSVLAKKASSLVFDKSGGIVDSDSYYQEVQNAINTVLKSDAYEYDLSSFIDDQTISKLKSELGITSFTRAEIFNKSIEQSLANSGMSAEQSAKIASEVGNRVLRTPGLFTMGNEGVKEAIANTLSSMGVANSEAAAAIAQNVNVDFILYGSPLEALEAVKVIGSNEFSELLDSKIESALKGELGDSAIGVVKRNVNEVVFGSPSLQKTELTLGLSENLSNVLENVTNGGDGELVNLVQQHFNQFKFPSLEMHEYLRNFTDAGAIVVKSLLAQSEGSSEEEMLRTITEQRM